MMDGLEKNVTKIDKNVLELYYKLCDKSSNIRLNACAEILCALWGKQQKEENGMCRDLKYSIGRLVKGLASARDAARLGYTLLLTKILEKINIVPVEEILDLIKKYLTSTSQQDKRDIVFGQLFAYTALVRSGRLITSVHLSEVILSLYDLCVGKTYVLNACYDVFLHIFSQLTNEDFKEKVWPQLKKKIQSDWEHCSTEPLWILLLCIHFFPDSVSTKYLRKHWGADDIFAANNLEHIKRIMKQTTSTLPVLHPLCSELYSVMKQRKDFTELWSTVIDENMFDLEQTEKACVGFGIIKQALQDSPTKKIIKTALSPKFRIVFSKSYLTSKHPLNPAANHLAEFMCNYVKDSTIPDVQIIILKTFIMPAGSLILDQVSKKKEVLLIIQSLLPDAVKSFCEILKAVFLKKNIKSGIDEKEINNMKRLQAVHQIANLVSHPAVLTDMKWRIDVIKFLFLHSFFTVKEPTSEIPYCDMVYGPLPDSVRDSCINEFFRTVNSLHMRMEKQSFSLDNFLQQLILLADFAELLMNSTEIIEPTFSVEKINDAWKHLRSMVQKLRKASTKDGNVNESNAFGVLFLQLGFVLFQDPMNISNVLEELYICCKKALKMRKQEADNSQTLDESSEVDPPWIGVVIDILLSLLSKSSKHLRNLVSFVFPLFCPFVNHEALQQILDVINPHKDEDMLVEESDEEDKDIDFGSGSSSDESENEPESQTVDEEFRRKVQGALGSAADASDTESVVLSDSEMFKLDNALSEVFKNRMKHGHTQLSSEDKTLLNFRMKCFDLIISYLKSEPPMHLVLMCIEPVLAAFELGHQGKHQSPLLSKAINVLQHISKMKKFQHHKDINKSELKRLLDVLIPKCHKEINMTIAQKLYSLCVFIVLCYRKLEVLDSPDKKKNSSKLPSYTKTYLSNLDTFVTSGSSNMLPQFFTHLMEACPDLAWYFVEPCKNYAFSIKIRLFKKTQCLGLLLEALKFSKNQKEITPDQWLEFGKSIFPLAIESLRSALNSPDIKPLYFTELLDVIYTSHLVIQDKTGQLLLKNHADLLPLLHDISKEKMKKLNPKGRSMRNKLIQCLERNTNDSQTPDLNDKDVSIDKSNKKKRRKQEKYCNQNLINGDVHQSVKKLKHKTRKSSENLHATNHETSSCENNVIM